MITGQNHIGRRRSGKGLVTFRSIDPFKDMENDWLFQQACEDELNEAVELAQKAFKDYRNTSPQNRKKFLETIADELLLSQDELITVYQLESGLPEGRAKAELNRTMNQLRLYGSYGASDEYLTPTTDNVNWFKLRKTMIPIGPIAVFGSSNFPFAYSTAGGDTASALAAGCPVIVKGHPLHPGTGELVASAILRAAEKCEMPNGVFSNLHALDHSVGRLLVMHPGIKGVGFTGSITGGKALYDLAAGRTEPIPVFAEMGSVNPVVFSESELRKNGFEWAIKLKESILDGTGQFCTNPGLIISFKSEALEGFLDHLVVELSSTESSCMLGRGIHRTFDQLRQERMLTEGTITIFEQKKLDQVNFATATLVKVAASTFLNNPNLHHEVFGPFSIVVECDTMEELIKVLSCLDGQLTGTINCGIEEKEFGTAVLEVLKEKVGRVVYNGVPTGVSVSNAMHHGGPYPATTDSRFTAVGGHAIYRWVRPISLQNVPEEWM